ncbi:MAG: beta-ketoacyl-ACP synthase II [FCB group bacterium]|nr:beta-ketoacyl-ACP synthase II [FCB group bacterium]
MSSPRVVVTGMGVLSPIGNTIDEFSSALSAGKNGIDKITLFDAAGYKAQLAGEIRNCRFEDFIDPRDLKKMDRFTVFGMIAALQAVEQSGLHEMNSKDREDIGVIIGAGVGGIETFSDNYERLLKSPRRVSPFFIPMMISDIAAGQVSIRYGFKGPNYSVVSACSSATHAIGDAFRMIKYGDAHAIVCGGAEAAVTPISLAGFANMKALTTNPDPATASRPFDAMRDGFVMGEGAGILVLEELEHARGRDAHILGEVVGYGATGDAYHLTTPAPDGEGAVRAMKKALADAGLEPGDIDYINAHGTSTPYNDKNETAAIKTVFGDAARHMYISSTKSMTGHLLGAAGGIEAIACLLAIRDGFVPPTINYAHPDPECDLNYVPNQKIDTPIGTAMSNTFGFGGHNGVLLFKKWDS